MSSNEREVTATITADNERPMSEQLVALVRDRVATRYYDQPQVIDVIARAMVRGRTLESRG